MSSANVTNLISVRLVSLGSFSKVKKNPSKTLLCADCTCMMTHAFRLDFFAVATRLRKKFPDRKSHFSRIEAKIILYEIKLQLSTQKSHFGFEVKITPTENIQEFRSVSAWNVSVCVQFVCRLTKSPRRRTKEPMARPGAFKRSGLYYDAGFSAGLKSCHLVTVQ